jgi:hypothetical protein
MSLITHASTLLSCIREELVSSLAGKKTILIEALHVVPQTLQKNAAIVPWNSPLQLLSTSFSIHLCKLMTLPCDITYFELLKDDK